MVWQIGGRLFASVQTLIRGYHAPLFYIPVLKDQKDLFSEKFDLTGYPSVNNVHVESLHKNIVFQFKNVDFGYSPNNTLLKDISFTINKGEIVAICGENGAGKSTLIKLLLGLYAPNKGSVLFEGLPLDKIPQDYFYGKIGVVFQDFMIYRLTLRENVAFGDISRINDTAAIIEAMRKGQADKLLRLLY